MRDSVHDGNKDTSLYVQCVCVDAENKRKLSGQLYNLAQFVARSAEVKQQQQVGVFMSNTGQLSSLCVTHTPPSTLMMMTVVLCEVNYKNRYKIIILRIRDLRFEGFSLVNHKLFAVRNYLPRHILKVILHLTYRTSINTQFRS